MDDNLVYNISYVLEALRIEWMDGTEICELFKGQFYSLNVRAISFM